MAGTAGSAAGGSAADPGRPTVATGHAGAADVPVTDGAAAHGHYGAGEATAAVASQAAGPVDGPAPGDPAAGDAGSAARNGPGRPAPDRPTVTAAGVPASPTSPAGGAADAPGGGAARPGAAAARRADGPDDADDRREARRSGGNDLEQQVAATVTAAIAQSLATTLRRLVQPALLPDIVDALGRLVVEPAPDTTTVELPATLLAQAEQAVAAGHAPSVTSYVTEAVESKGRLAAVVGKVDRMLTDPGPPGEAGARQAGGAPVSSAPPPSA
jgi:hypothetical protein